MTFENVLEKWGAKSVTPMEVYTDNFHLGEGMIQVKNEPKCIFKFLYLLPI